MRPKKAMSEPTLYSYYRSSASFRVRIALALKGINYEYRAICLVEGGTGQHVKGDYRCVNPMCQVPALLINGITLTQSIPIIEYLDETFPEKTKLLPTDPLQRAQARRIAEIVNSGIHPLLSKSTLKKLAELTGDDGGNSSWTQYFLSACLQGLERVLEQTSGNFCVGDDVSIADLALVPQYINAARHIDMAQFPTVSRVALNCLQMEAFQVAHPDMQPDCPTHEKNFVKT